MSQEQVEAIRRSYEALNGRDFNRLVQNFEPKVELYPGIKAPDQPIRYVGRQEAMEFFRGATETWERVIAEPTKIVESAPGRFLAFERWRFVGRAGIEVERDLQTLFSFRGALILRIDGFTDKAEALEAAGLSE